MEHVWLSLSPLQGFPETGVRMGGTDLLTPFNLLQVSVSSKRAWKWEWICLQGGVGPQSCSWSSFREIQALSMWTITLRVTQWSMFAGSVMVLLDTIAHLLSLLKPHILHPNKGLRDSEVSSKSIHRLWGTADVAELPSPCYLFWCRF